MRAECSSYTGMEGPVIWWKVAWLAPRGVEDALKSVNLMTSGQGTGDVPMAITPHSKAGQEVEPLPELHFFRYTCSILC